MAIEYSAVKLFSGAKKRVYCKKLALRGQNGGFFIENPLKTLSFLTEIL